MHPVNYFLKVVLLKRKLNIDDNDIKKKLIKILENDLFDQVEISIGKGIDIDPKGLTKAQGMHWFLQVNQIDPRKSIFIADAERDLPAAQVLTQNGGYFGLVGNTSENVRGVIPKERNYILAPENTEYHSSSTFILKEFLKIIENLENER